MFSLSPQPLGTETLELRWQIEVSKAREVHHKEVLKCLGRWLGCEVVGWCWDQGVLWSLQESVASEASAML